jgi:hypothetical protein
MSPAWLPWVVEKTDWISIMKAIQRKAESERYGKIPKISVKMAVQKDKDQNNKRSLHRRHPSKYPE